MIETVERFGLVPELGTDENICNDPAARFGLKEARRHRARGGNLSLFLGKMKYYRQSYLDLLRECDVFDHPEAVDRLVVRFYDRTVLAYCNEWAGADAEAQIKRVPPAH
jgi:hypothetical protein